MVRKVRDVEEREVLLTTVKLTKISFVFDLCDELL